MPPEYYDELKDRVRRAQAALERLTTALRKEDVRAASDPKEKTQRGTVSANTGMMGSFVVDPKTNKVVANTKPAHAGSILVNEALAEINRQQAERDIRIADFYRHSGHLGSAIFYYELVCRRYPGTPIADTAQQRLAELR